MPIELLGSTCGPTEYSYDGNQAAWLKWAQDRDPTTKSGNPGRVCMIVKGSIDLTEGAEDVSELLCAGGATLVDLGHGVTGKDLIINPEGGTVYVNGHTIDYLIGLQYLNDGSWGVKFGKVDHCKPKNRLLGFLQRTYSAWLELVYEKASYLGLIETSPLHEKSIWHLFISDLPKGKIISQNPKKVLDKGTLS